VLDPFQLVGMSFDDLDRQIAQIDAAIEEATRRGHSGTSMVIADRERHNRTDLVAARQKEAKTLTDLQAQKAKLDLERRQIAAEIGPIKYLAQVIGGPDVDLERAVRMLTLALVLVLDPMAVMLLLASTGGQRRRPAEA